jgi:hypothetical protein
MDRVCVIVVIPDVDANVDPLAAARAYRAVSSAEGRATQGISSTIAEDLRSLMKIPYGGI